MTMRRLGAIALSTVTVLLLLGCGERDDVWDQPVASNTGGGGELVVTHGLRSSAALVDVGAERVIFASAADARTLAFSAIATDRGYATSVPTRDGEKLVILSRGDPPPQRKDDQLPSLAVVNSLARPLTATRFELSDPLSGLELDPTSEYAVVYPTAADTSFVQNPNELLLVKLKEPPSDTNPVPATLRSFGGRPEGFTFTPPLELPGGKRRLLVVRTDRDVALIDLNAPERPEITVKLTAGTASPRPVGIAVTDGEPGDENDARLAVRLEQDPNVILLDLLPTPADKVDASPHSFLPVPNIVDVGGTPADIAFGRTDGGLRLLALVPSRQALVLLEPSTGITSEIALGAPFERLSIVTDIVGATTEGSDVALLWSTSSPNIAFVSLGVTSGKPYKSVERISLPQPVSSVTDIPAPNANLKILTSADGLSFVVLNLVARTESPLTSSQYGTQVQPSPDGKRLWMYSQSVGSLALVDLESLHPKNLVLSYPVSSVFDIERTDGGRALIALHGIGSHALTLFDANAPSVDQSTEYLGVLLGEYQ
jgi:hypothetical protein